MSWHQKYVAAHLHASASEGQEDFALSRIHPTKFSMACVIWILSTRLIHGLRTNFPLLLGVQVAQNPQLVPRGDAADFLDYGMQKPNHHELVRSVHGTNPGNGVHVVFEVDD